MTQKVSTSSLHTGKAKSETQLRRERQAWTAERVQAMVDNTTFSDKVRALEGTFNAKLKDFMEGMPLEPGRSSILQRQNRMAINILNCVVDD